jgi:hypothetical protein
MNECCLAHGQLLVHFSLTQLREFLHDLPVQLRESSHYEGGQYLIVRADHDARITFEKITATEFLLAGEASTKEGLAVICQQVSAVLSKAQLRHRLELYDAADTLYQYLHYDWPIVGPTAAPE